MSLNLFAQDEGFWPWSKLAAGPGGLEQDADVDDRASSHGHGGTRARYYDRRRADLRPSERC